MLMKEELCMTGLQRFIKTTCEKYNFTYTIIPLEAIYDVSDSIDLKNVSDDEAKLIDAEKKKDEENHSVPIK
jgi:hypothetical protein